MLKVRLGTNKINPEIELNSHSKISQKRLTDGEFDAMFGNIFIFKMYYYLGAVMTM